MTRRRPEVVIDARAAARPELGGVERFARELTTRLPALRPGRYSVARPPRALSHRAGHAWEQALLPLRRAELLLCPANAAPLLSRRNVVLIFDVAPLREPGWYSPAYVALQRVMLPRIASRARLVMTSSEFSRREISETLAVPPERIAVVPGGVDDRFRPRADPEPAMRRYGLTPGRPYVLTVASATARKNLTVLTGVARSLAADGIEVVAAGGDRPQFRGDGVLAGLRTLGHVDDDLLPSLYAGASAFVLPSLYEGFGLTALEALASGVPVVSSDRGALPEVCGDAAMLVDPLDADAIAGALRSVLASPDRWRVAGPRRAEPFTWEATAAAVDARLSGLLAR